MKLLILLLLPFTLFASTTWRNSAQRLLPDPLQKFELHKTSLSEVEKKLGTADLIEGNKYYWEKDGLKYALQLTFNQKKILKTLHYTFTKDAPSVDKVIEQIDLKKFGPHPAEGRSIGRFLITREKDGELIIDPVSKTIHTVKLQ